MSMQPLFILAGQHRHAKEWLRRNGIPPTGNHFRYVFEEHVLQGIERGFPYFEYETFYSHTGYNRYCRTMDMIRAREGKKLTEKEAIQYLQSVTGVKS